MTSRRPAARDDWRRILLVTALFCCLLRCSSDFPASAGAASDVPSKRPTSFLIIIADDLGFSDIGAYGGEIRTPNLDQLAATGLRFTQFYDTGRCWPTRSSLLTGYYAQQIGMDPPSGSLPVWARLLPRSLKAAGYRSYHSGKWHVTGAPKPVADGGFDRSYVVDDTDRHFHPHDHRLDDERLPVVEPGSGYYTTDAIADRAIEFLKQHAEQHSDTPFFEYVAFLSPHFPLQAPPEDIARYRDRYAEGWDVVRERRRQRLKQMGIVDVTLGPLEAAVKAPYFQPKLLDALGPGEVPNAVPWKSLTDEQKRFQASKMAIYAAMVDHMDQAIGRLLAQIRAMGAWDDTLVFFLSDNGADASLLTRGDGHDPKAVPGSAASFLCLGPGWASAGNAPFRRFKIWVHEGGIATPLIAHWPRGIRGAGALRRSVGHVIDLAPTLLELARVARPDGTAGAPPLPGKSLTAAFAKDGDDERELFFDHAGNRGLRSGDWKLVSSSDDGDVWRLYDLATDRGEAKDLAPQHPERVRRMSARWQELEAQYRKDAGSASAPPAH